MIAPMSFSPARGLSRWRQASSLAGASAFDRHRGPGKELRRWLRPTSRRRHRCPRIRHSQQIELGASGRIERADIPGLCARAQALLTNGAANQLVCDVGAIIAPDAVTVDALARLQLTARRMGREVWIRHASPELYDLLAFMGLSGVVPLSERSGVQARRQTEQREQGSSVEEERDSADPAT